LVFKQYIVSGADAWALRTLVEFPRSLPPIERECLLARTAWPLAVVVQHGELRGFLMQAIPPEFAAPNAAGNPRLRELQYLLYPPKPIWGGILPSGVGTETRLAVAAEFTRLMKLLHGKDLVFGDVSMLNVMWAPGDPARIFVLDCDGVRKLGNRPVLPQAETPDWDDPQQPAVGSDLDTDRYKLALLIGRVLSGQAYIRPEKHSLALPPDIPRAVAVRAQHLWREAAGRRGTRPDAGQWLMALEGQTESLLTSLPPPAHPERPAIPPAPRMNPVDRPIIRLPPPAAKP
jgi:hypothetical protein